MKLNGPSAFALFATFRVEKFWPRKGSKDAKKKEGIIRVIGESVV
jgi:hypothetical protein